MNYWKKGCAYLLENDPVFEHYYNPNHQLKTNKNKFVAQGANQTVKGLITVEDVIGTSPY